MNKNGIRIILITIITVITLIITVIMVINLMTGKGTLEVVIYPPDSNYKIMGKVYTGNQKIKLSSGSYNVVFYRNFFKNYNERIKIKKNQIKKLEILLKPSEEINNLETSLNGKDLEYVDYAEQFEFQQNKEIFIKNNPIIKKLPLKFDKFRIDYATKNETEITIEVTLYTEFVTNTNRDELKNEALNILAPYKINATGVIWYENSKQDFPE